MIQIQEPTDIGSKLNKLVIYDNKYLFFIISEPDEGTDIVEAIPYKSFNHLKMSTRNTTEVTEPVVIKALVMAHNDCLFDSIKEIRDNYLQCELMNGIISYNLKEELNG